jgi:DNA polymerase-3 subunit gamma/tau
MDQDSALFPAEPAAPKPAGDVYRVLARKYRPDSFAALIGQDALVRTLTNAIASGRIAHAFMFTGVRGVGKTTTARIIARMLNCVGIDGKGGPTVTPCGVCDQCTSIAQDRNVDVIEMDAASRTGVDDIREVIDGVRYRPINARYKIYIIDEVHMLSKNAFNALLKTLEEPPDHVKFVFATTEIRKVPVTVLSRCQRFDLRRVDAETLAKYFAGIAAKENVEIEPEAVALIARAADGSVRDGLSLLDRAIALSTGAITAQQLRDMLGLADRMRIYDLFEAMMAGKPPETLELLADLHNAGADAGVVIEDLLDATHAITRAKIAPPKAADAVRNDQTAARAAKLAERLDMATLTRTWQILIKGLSEVRAAPQPMAAAEMVLLRLLYAAPLPSPGDTVKRALEGGFVTSPSPAPIPSGGDGSLRMVQDGRGRTIGGAPILDNAPVVSANAQTQTSPRPETLEAIVALARERGDHILATQIESFVQPVRVAFGVIEFVPTADAPQSLSGRLGQQLQAWTDTRWRVSIANRGGEPTLRARAEAIETERLSAARRHPTVKAVLDRFPGATITGVRRLDQPPALREAGEDDDIPSLDDNGDEIP